MRDDGLPFEHEAGWGADESSVVMARDFVTECLTDHGMSPAIDDVRWAVSELATNAVVHAGTAFTVNLSRLDGVLTLSVGDGSPVFARQVRSATELALGGRGLRIVGALSTAWGVTATVTGKSVWATFDPGTLGVVQTAARASASVRPRGRRPGRGLGVRRVRRLRPPGAPRPSWGQT